ncbi:MAG TPA: hypothetical protein VMV10_07810 [Pirellulales bacterium]|nr:hypothetical protein [Pirellulales bacterium]
MSDRIWRWFSAPAAGLICAAVVALTVDPANAAEEEAEFTIHEVSLWGFDPTLEQANQLQHYPSLMPGIVDTDRSRAGAESKLAPFSLLTFHGQPVKNLEIDLRAQAGRFTAHWPPAESKSGRLRWLDVNLSAEPGKEVRIAPVDAKSWFNAARQLDALHLSLGARSERFIVYEVEFKLDQPLEISGGPDRYQAANLSKSPLADVLVIAPAADGRRRIGRAALLPPKAPTSAQKPTESQPADQKPGDAKSKGDESAAAKQAAGAKVSQAAAAVKNALIKVAGAGAAKPAAPREQVAADIAGEPVEIEMSAPLDDESPELAAARQTLAESLKQQGLTEAEAELFMDRSAPAIFGAKELIVVCRLPADAIEERLPLVTYPAALKTVRTALVVLRNVDPQLKDDVNRLVTNLGAADYAEREAAEKRLLELGRLAVPALKAALKSPDVEVQFRAERLLLSQNEKVDGT